MQLIVLLTHHFNDIFLNTLLKLNHSVNTDYKIIVLFDNKMDYDKNIEEILINIKTKLNKDSFITLNNRRIE
jgi:hypothetical protein